MSSEPDPGVRGRILLRVLARDPFRWPAGELIDASGLDAAPAWEALHQLRQLELAAADPSDDGVVRFVATPRGHRIAARRRA